MTNGISAWTLGNDGHWTCNSCDKRSPRKSIPKSHDCPGPTYSDTELSTWSFKVEDVGRGMNLILIKNQGRRYLRSWGTGFTKTKSELAQYIRWLNKFLGKSDWLIEWSLPAVDRSKAHNEMMMELNVLYGEHKHGNKVNIDLLMNAYNRMLK